MFTIIATTSDYTLNYLLSPSVQAGQVSWSSHHQQTIPERVCRSQGASIVRQEPLQPCPVLAGFSGAWVCQPPRIL